MDFNLYTKDQQLAITEKGKNIIVSAGAGSGKTQVLTERVVYFIKNHHYKLDEFLILTFTNLAAAEMKDRIRKALKEENLKEASDVDTCDISTFDAYALALVRKYHLLLNVSANISIIDSNIIEVRKRTILDEICENLYKTEDSIFLEMIERFCFKDDADIKNLILTFYKKASDSVDTNNYLDTFTTNYYSDEHINQIIQDTFNYLTKDKDELLKLLKNLPDVYISKSDNRTYKEACYEVLDSYLNAKTFDEITGSIPKSLGFNKPRGLLDIESENVKKFQDFYKKLYEKLSEFPTSSSLFKENILSTLIYANKMIDIIKLLDAQIKNYKNKYQVFEFNDIAKMALSLVKNYQEVKNTIKNKLKMIMVDEYQDTSVIQEQFISEIANNNVYMVGDVKQSIYRFRNARCDIFIDKYDAYKYDRKGIAIDLKKNFRSRKEVLDDINYIFKHIMTKELGGASYLEDHLIEFGNKDYDIEDTNVSKNLDFILYSEKNNVAFEIEPHLIAKDIINKVNNKYLVFDKKTKRLRPCKFSDFCILMDRGTNFTTYAKVFNEYKIPLTIENDENISTSNIVLVLSNLLKLVKCIKNNDFHSKEFIRSFIGVARSNLFSYSDNQIYNISKTNSYYQDKIITLIKETLYLTNIYPIYEQIETLIFKLDIYNKCILTGDVTKNEKYLDTFLQMFKSMSDLDYSLDDFILYLEYIDTYNLKINLSSTPTSVDSVRLMNIHKSKGLEFSIVYFSGLYKTFNQEEYKKQFGISNKYGLMMPPKEIDEVNIIKVLNEEYEKQEDISERIRLFYVALTRTKEKMIFVVNHDLATKYEEKFNQDLFENFIKTNNLNNLDDFTIYQLVVKHYLNQKITYEVFLKLIAKFNILYPNEFLDKSFNEMKEYPINDLINYYNRLNDIYQQAIIKYPNTIDRINYLYQKQKSNVLTIDEFNYLIQKLNYKLNPSFDYLVDTVTSLDIMEISKNIDYQNINQITNGFKAYFNNTITLNQLSAYLSIFDLTINLDELKKANIDTIDYNKVLNGENNIYIPYTIFLKKISNFNEQEILLYIYLYHNKYLYQDAVTQSINALTTYNVSFSSFEKVVNLIGYQLTPVGKKELSLLNNHSSSEEINSVLSKPFNSYFTYLPSIFKNIYQIRLHALEFVLKDIYILFKTRQIDLQEVSNLINALGYELDIDFKNLNEEDKYLQDEENLNRIFVEKKQNINLENILSFNDLIIPFINYRKYHKYYISPFIKEIGLNIKDDSNKSEKLIVNEININTQVKETFRASKNLNISSNIKNLEFGTNIHFILEIIDFINPNYDLVQDEFYINIIKNFLNSPLLKDIKNGKIYKEYEFIDEITSTKGIIDLMIVYDDYIDIIDYKTKNIDDDSYLKQLKVYETYIKTKYNKQINTYLYSLLSSEYKKCN